MGSVTTNLRFYLDNFNENIYKSTHSTFKMKIRRNKIENDIIGHDNKTTEPNIDVAMFCIVFRLYIYHVLVINRWSTYILYTIISSVFVLCLNLFTLFTIWFVYIWNILMENGMCHFQRYLHCMVLPEELRYRNPRPFFVFLFYDCCKNRPCFVDVFTKVTNVWVSPVACLQKVAKKAIYIRNHTHLWYCVLFFLFLFLFYFVCAATKSLFSTFLLEILSHQQRNQCNFYANEIESKSF